jgi:hypothetical protein
MPKSDSKTHRISNQLFEKKKMAISHLSRSREQISDDNPYSIHDANQIKRYDSINMQNHSVGK